MLVLDLLAEYADQMAGEGMSDQTIRRYCRIVRGVARWADDECAVADLTPELMAEYQAELGRRGLAERTVRIELSAVRSFSIWCIRRKLRVDDPTLTLRWPRPPRTRPKALTGEELRSLAEALARVLTGRGRSAWMWERNQRAIYILLYAGLRLGELAALDWRQVDLVWGVIHVVRGKGSKDRAVPISDELWPILERVPRELRRGPVIPAGWRKRHYEHPEQAFLNERGLAKIFSVWLPSIGVTSIHAHRLRHTCATQMRLNGADLKDIQEILGHESLETTDGYLGSDPDHLRDAINRLPPLAEMGRRRAGRPRLTVMEREEERAGRRRHGAGGG